MKEKIFVLSMDAMVSEDLEYLRTKPNFSRLFKDCAQVKTMQSIYPSITYPAHISMITGCRPGKHGVFTNDELTPFFGHIRWHLDSRMVQVEDIFAAAKRAGLTTAAIYWPVMGWNANVDYLLNEGNFYDSKTQKDVEKGFREMGSSEEMLAIARKNKHLFPSDRHNANGQLRRIDEFDDFLMACACDVIRQYQPDLMVVHNCWMDTLRHTYGVFNHHVTAGLDAADEWLGQVMEAMEEAGTLDDTNFILVSDHGQMDFARRIKINVLLRRGGFIDVDDQGNITQWRAFGQANGMSVVVVLKDPADEKLYREVGEYLRRLESEEVWGFTVHTQEEVRERYGVYGNFAYMLETDGYTAFGESWLEPLVNPVDLSDYRLGKATHGYEPEKGPQPVFVASGPAFRPGAVLEQASIIDEAPTYAAIFGQTLPQAEGRCLRELLR